jgi:quinol-cytochrome oxidoreductase complex cytochrome b subunit
MTLRIKTFPDLVRREVFAAVVAITAVFLLSAVLDAPIGGPADPSGIPAENVKAPWIFVGIQQMLRYLPTMVAGVLVPGAALLGLIAMPFISEKPNLSMRLIFSAIILISLAVTVWGYLA